MNIEELKAEVERLKTEVEHLMVFCNCTLIPNKELQAEVERLRKAGDFLYGCNLAMLCNNPENEALKDGLKRWNAAKDGKPDINKVEIDDETWDRENKAYKEARAKEGKQS